MEKTFQCIKAFYAGEGLGYRHQDLGNSADSLELRLCAPASEEEEIEAELETILVPT